MNAPLTVCELCERSGAPVTGTTHFGGHRFEVCADCRTIVSIARSQVAQLPSSGRPQESVGLHATGEAEARPLFPKCPACQRRDPVRKLNSAIGNKFCCGRCNKCFRTETIGVLSTPVWD